MGFIKSCSLEKVKSAKFTSILNFHSFPLSDLKPFFGLFEIKKEWHFVSICKCISSKARPEFIGQIRQQAKITAARASPIGLSFSFSSWL